MPNNSYIPMTKLIATVMVIVLLNTIGCERKEIAKVNLDRKAAIQQINTATKRHPFRLGMGAMITPREGFAYYLQLAKYLEKKLGQPVVLVDRSNYDEISKMLQAGELEAAFVCSGPYVEGKDKFGLQLLAIPQVHGKTVYSSYIIAPADSKCRDFSQLRGKTFAFTDPKSNTGKIVPTYMLAQMHETPETFFGKTIYTYGHDKSIKAIAQNMIDGAAVDSLIFDYMIRKNPDLSRKIRIIATSAPCGISPIVAPSTIDPGTRKKLVDTLLELNNSIEGKDILAGMMIDRFVPGNDQTYDSIRAMNAWIKEHKGK